MYVTWASYCSSIILLTPVFVFLNPMKQKKGFTSTELSFPTNVYENILCICFRLIMEMITMVLGLLAELTSFAMQYVHLFFIHSPLQVEWLYQHRYPYPQVHGMLTQMDPALIAFCDNIAAQGGPLNVPDALRGTVFPSAPAMQLGTVTRASARLRNVQPEVDFNRSYEALKRPKKNTDAAHHAGIVNSLIVCFVFSPRS